MGIKARNTRIAPASGSDASCSLSGAAAASDGQTSTSQERACTGRRYFRCSDPWSAAEEAKGIFFAAKRDDTTCSEASDYTDAGDFLNGSGTSADPAHYLLLYFAHLSRRRAEEIDFAHMEQLLKAGASVNATSGSHSVLHEAAAAWDVTVAEFLLQRGAEVDLLDSHGGTALHVAARTNHSGMVECLLLHGANIDTCTLTEEQTPVHYAARSDSVKALQVLVQHGGDYEARDYKGRTPLHLAAELDRTVAAQYLLSLPHPAECRVHDNQGNSALVSIIRTMPKVALLALSQLHRLAPADRKQYFLLSHLEPEPDSKNTLGVKTPFEMTVEEERYEILTHPVMKELAEWKWKTFVRFYFYLYLVLYLLFMLSWSILIAMPSAQEKHLYVFPYDTWRVLLELVALGTYFHQIAEEILEFARSRNTHRAYTAMRVRSLQDDLSKMDSSLQEERKYLEQELLRARKSKSNYLSDPWNIIDIVTFVVLFILIILHALDVAAHSEQLAHSVARLSCPAVILVWVRLLKHLRGFKSLGPLIAIIQQVMGDILRFFIIISIFYIPYIICFWVQFGGPQSAGLEENTDLQQYYRVIIMLFRMTLIDDYPYDTLRRIDELMTSVLVMSFLVITSIVGLNLFIALLTDTFQRVYDNAQANAEMQKAQIMIELEYKAWQYWRTRYQRIIHSRCNPCSKYYDDDDTDAENDTPAQLRKITHQIHDLISSLQGESEGVGRGGGTEAGVSDRLDRQEDQIQAVSEHLLEIRSLLLSQQGGTQDNASGDATSINQPPVLPTNEGEEPNNSTTPTRPLPPQVILTEVGELSTDQPINQQTWPQLLPPLALHNNPRFRPIFRLPLVWNRTNPSPSHSLVSHDSRLHAYSGSESIPHLLQSRTQSSLPQSSPVHFGFTRTNSRVLLDIYRTDSEYSICNHRRIQLKSAQEMAEDQWEERVARSKTSEHFQR